MNAKAGKSAPARTHETSAGRKREALKLMKRILLRLRNAMDEKLKPHGCTAAQMRLLVAIRNAPGSSGAELSRQCEITPQTAQALIQRAEHSGWIVRGKDRVNERIVTALLTPAGDKLLDLADGLMKDLETKLWQDLSDPGLAKLITLLESCLENLSEPN